MHRRDAQEVAVDDLVINDADNARMKPVDIEHLMDSIQANGLLHPITVKSDEGKYRVVAGFNRAHAVKQLGLKKVLVMIDHTKDPTQLLLLQISENLDREDFTAFEMATALQRLTTAGMARGEIAAHVHRSQAWCSNYLGLFDLPDEVQEKVKADTDNYQVHHIRFLHALQKHVEPEKLIKIADDIGGMSSTQLAPLRERLMAKLKPDLADEEESTVAAAPPAPEPKALPPPISQSEPSYEEDSSGPVVRRLAYTVKIAIDALNGYNGDVQVAKLQGAIEALQWVLGDDEIELFASLDLELMDAVA